jgi:hydrogenase maturation protease
MDIRVLGLGNVLMGDDGVGPYVIEALAAAYRFPAGVSLLDLGTPGLDLAPFLLGADAVVVIDSVLSDGTAGALRQYRRDAILAHAPPHRLGPHDPGFKQTLLTLEFAARAPKDVLLVGIVPKGTAPGAGLSPEVQEAVPLAVAAVVAELQRLGKEPVPVPCPAAVSPWWERVARE